MVDEPYESIKSHEDFEDFVQKDIVEISKMKRRNFKSLPSKCIFKAMELVDKMDT